VLTASEWYRLVEAGVDQVAVAVARNAVLRLLVPGR